MHSVSIKSKGKVTWIELDGFLLQGVIGYELKSSVENQTELSLKLYVRDLELGFDKGSDDVRGNLTDGIE